MQSTRFRRTALVTQHARHRMVERDIDETRLLDLIESGETRYKDDERLWIYKSYFDRTANLLCIAVALAGDTLVVKTVMHHFEIS